MHHNSKSSKNVIDLFSGVGGLSLGAARAGFNLVAGVELDARALEYHAINFPSTLHLSEDVGKLSGEHLLKLAGLEAGELHGLIGGPPCQGFSDMGLRSETDPRSELLVHFFRLVAETSPAFFMAENVPGVLQERNAPFVERALSMIPPHYVLLEPLVIKASDYGAPTIRTRVFFIGYDPERINSLNAADFTARRAEDVRVSRALQLLPSIRSDWQSEHQSWRAVGELPDFAFENSLSNAIPHGVGNPRALDLYRTKRLVSGFLGTAHTKETVKRFNILKPGKSDPISKCVRLDRAGYCPTLRAGTGPERGSYQAIRPVHPSSPRVIAPREAARLQGFPDWFQFHPTKWHAFRQIGNSVSPLVAEHLLYTIYNSF